MSGRTDPITEGIRKRMCGGYYRSDKGRRAVDIDLAALLHAVNDLKARLAAAEAEAERARGLLVEASGWMKAECYSLHHRRNQYHASDEACPVEALQSELLARIDAHLASRPEGEVPDGR